MASSQNISLPQALPVMLLSGCTLFPHALLPLFIYEPRYRRMLEHSLQTDRLFCIGSLLEGDEWPENDESDARVSPCSTVGLIRACVRHDDGTAHLMLQGLTRIRFDGWEQHIPFRMAKVERSPSVEGNRTENRLLARRLLTCVSTILQNGPPGSEELSAQLATLEDPEVLADFVAANFLPVSNDRHRLLAMDAVGHRLAYLLSVLDP